MPSAADIRPDAPYRCPPNLQLVGDFGFAVGAAKEYHESTAVISAMVAPTAWDVGYGLRFAPDLVLYKPQGQCSYDGLHGKPCQIKSALSFRDLHEPVEYYHQATMLCLATETHPGRDGFEPAITTGQNLFTLGEGMRKRSVPQNPNQQNPSQQRTVCENISFKQLPGQEGRLRSKE